MYKPQLSRILQSTRLKRLLKIFLFICITFLLVSFLAYIFRTQLLTGLAEFLIIDDELQPVDVIFVLNGDVDTRPFRAAELFKQGLAPQVVIPKEEDSPAVEIGLYPNGTDVAIEVMKALGVPGKNIVMIPVEGGVTSTRDEAKVLRRYVETHGIKRVILVTSAFHTRRARWIFERELADSAVTLEIAAAPQWEFDETNWWKDERGLITFANEYIKLAYYFAVY